MSARKHALTGNGWDKAAQLNSWPLKPWLVFNWQQRRQICCLLQWSLLFVWYNMPWFYLENLKQRGNCVSVHSKRTVFMCLIKMKIYINIEYLRQKHALHETKSLNHQSSLAYQDLSICFITTIKSYNYTLRVFKSILNPESKYSLGGKRKINFGINRFDL